jgi:hypothetical protein
VLFSACVVAGVDRNPELPRPLVETSIADVNDKSMSFRFKSSFGVRVTVGVGAKGHVLDKQPAV